MSYEKLNILYTGSFRFPDGDAAALRVLGIAKLFPLSKYNVEFAGWEQNNQKESYLFQGYNCYSQNELDNKYNNIFKRLWFFIFKGNRTIKWIKSKNKYDTIILYNPPALFAFRVLLLSKRNKIKVILDLTEWYESSHLVGGKYGIVSFENMLRMRLVYPIFKNTITISSYLKKFYQNKNENQITIPPILDFSQANPNKEINDCLKFIYAGQIGKKDKIIEFIKFLPKIEEAIHIKVEFNIAGMKESELEELLDNNNCQWNKYSKFINCHGFLNREKVLKLYADNHFSILFRDNSRYAHAGFPTKSVESWSQSCPLITNNIGDLNMYTKNAQNCIITDNLFNGLINFLNELISKSDYANMRVKSFETYINNFSPDTHKEKFEIFIERLI